MLCTLTLKSDMHQIFLMAFFISCLNSLIFQQYSNGFRVELKYKSVILRSQAKTIDGVRDAVTTKSEINPNGT